MPLAQARCTLASTPAADELVGPERGDGEVRELAAGASSSSHCAAGSRAGLTSRRRSFHRRLPTCRARSRSPPAGRPRTDGTGRRAGWRTRPRRDPHPAQGACGLNFIDVYQRSGLYPSCSCRPRSGMEASGVVEAVGSGVTHLKAGDRAAYASHPPGSYSELRVMPAQQCLQAARCDQLRRPAPAMMLKGLIIPARNARSRSKGGLEGGRLRACSTRPPAASA